jgi:hypothetical protein
MVDFRLGEPVLDRILLLVAVCFLQHCAPQPSEPPAPTSAPSAVNFAQQRNAFLDKYLEDPFRVIDQADLGFETTIYLYDIGTVQQITKIFLTGTQLRDINNDGRADLVVPIEAQLANGATKTGEPIFYNQLNVPHFDRTHAEFFESALPAGATESNTAIGLFGDLNGYGFQDSINVWGVLGGTHTMQSQDANGTSVLPIQLNTPWPILVISNVQIAMGLAIVPERDAPKKILGARLGYLAGYAMALSQANAPSSGANGASTSTSAPSTIGSTPSIVWDTNDARLRQLISDTSTKNNSSSAVPGGGNVSPAQKQAQVQFVSVVARIPTEHPELDFDIVTREAFFPDMTYYAAGLTSGIQKGAQDKATLYKAAQTVKSATQKLGNLDSAASELKSAPGDINTQQKVRGAVGELSQPDLESAVKGSTKVLGEFPLMPRKVDLVFKPQTPHVNGELPLATFLTAAYIQPLDTQGMISGEDAIVINSGGIGGSALASLYLNSLRSDPNYLSKIGTDGDATRYYITDATSRVQPIAESEVKYLAVRPDVATLTGADLVSATMASGFSDLVVMVANDAAKQAYLKGVAEGKAEALRYIKDSLGSQVPALEKAQTIEEATEILKNTLKDLDDDLKAAKKLIADLTETNQQLRADLDQARQTLATWQGTGEAATRFLDAGTGFLIGGPIGAAACAFLCGLF